jgi:formylglycine-generating enzyme required for sulfatase activity
MDRAAGVFFFVWVCLMMFLPSSTAAQPSGMVLVPAGDFMMGTDEADQDDEALSFGLPQPWYEDEHPLHKVNLPGFYIDRYEVTRTRYAKFIKATELPPPPEWAEGTYPSGTDNLPVVYVSWFEAAAYCQWAGKRLPTEEEWEKAARGPRGRKYPWGDTFKPDFANIADGSKMSGSPVSVGRYESGKSPYGVYDMIGNVWEWVDGWYGPYAGNQAKNENFGKNLRVMRGLSFMAVGHYPPAAYLRVSSIVARAAFRSYDVPGARLPDVGFRCAKSKK